MDKVYTEGVQSLIRSLVSMAIQDSWCRIIVEIYVATEEMSVKFEYRFVNVRNQLQSLSVDARQEDKLFDTLVEWCLCSLTNPDRKWNRLHMDFTSDKSNFYYYWDQWYYDTLYSSLSLE